MSEYIVINGKAAKILHKENEGSLIKVCVDEFSCNSLYIEKDWICKGLVTGRLTEEDDEVR